MTPHPATTPGGPRQTIVSALAVTAVLLGAPLLLSLAGNPWPQQTTSLAGLTARLAQPLSDQLALHLLALLGWACWAAFALTVVREILWYAARLPHLRRDASLHTTHLDHLTAVRFLIATCVGGLLLTFLTWARPLPATAHTADNPTATAHTADNPTATARPSSTALSGPASQHTAAKKNATGPHPYTVRPGDTLWDIAKHRLGDPLRWPEIYALSRHLPQPGGQHLSDPHLLRPGWHLRLPADARPPARDPGNAPATRDDAAQEEHHLKPPPPQPAPEPEQPAAPAPDEAADPHPTEGKSPAPSARPVHIPLATASVIGVTTAAGVAAAVALARARTRRHRNPGTPSGPPTLSAAVRAANHAALAARLNSPDSQDDPGITHRPAPAAPAPPGTVTIAQRADAELPLDTLATSGGWNLTGPGATPAARALITATLSAASRLAPRPPAVRLLICETLANTLLPRLPAPGSPALVVTPDTATALHQARTAAVTRARAREAGCLAAAPMDVLLLHAATGPEAHDLAQRAAPGELAVLSLHGEKLASTAHLAADGTATTTGPHQNLLEGATFFVLAPGPAGELLTVLLPATPQEATTATVPPPADPPAAPPPPPATLARDETPSPPPGKTEEERTPPLTVRLLGGISLHYREKEVPVTLKNSAKEFLALLASHPKGVLNDTITDALRLSTDPDQATRSLVNLRRAVRRALRQATGSTSAAFVLQTPDRHRLDPQLLTSDVAAFAAALDHATQASTPQDRARHLSRALAHYRGPFCHGADYPWADELREHYHHKAVDTAVRLADRTLTPAEEAIALLERAAAWEPTNEQICRRLMRLHHDLGHPEAAQHAYQRLERHLAGIDASPAPATRAILDSTTTTTPPDLRKEGVTVR